MCVMHSVDRVMFHSQTTSRSLRRDSSVCYYKDDDGSCRYGRIIAFITMTPTSTVIQKFDSHSVSLLGQGWPSLLTNTARVQRCRQLYDLQLFMNGIESKTESLIPTTLLPRPY